MKRLLSLLILVIFLMAIVPFSAQAATDTWDGTTDTEWYTSNTTAASYTISTGAELAGLADLVNGGFTFENKTITLAADINLAGSESQNAWTPIGIATSRFRGTFDGAGHTITGLYINEPDKSYQGLFGYIHFATIKNISVDGTLTGSNNVGGVVGYNYVSTVTNCYNSGMVTGANNVGGVVGYSDDGQVTDCANSGTVTGTDYVGGVVGLNADGTVTNCSNSSMVSGTNNVGGVAGYNGGGGTVTNCYSSGTLTGEYNVGGVVGNNSNNSRVANSYNTGDIHILNGGVRIGGVVGNSEGAPTGNSFITNCYHSGTISLAGSASYVGGVVGLMHNTTVQNSYYLPDVDATSIVGFDGNNNTINHVGSFSAADAPIAIDSSATEDETIPTGSLLAALNAGVMAYNTTDTDPTTEGDQFPSIAAILWTVDTAHNNGYPYGVAYWSDYAKLGDADWAATTVEIDTAEEFAHFANLVAGGTDFRDRTVTLAKDIDLSGRIWTPIGTSENDFYGTLDGAGYAITGLYVNAPESNFQGLFRTIEYYCTVKNLSLSGSVTGNQDVGGIAGASDGNIVNCTIAVTVTGKNYVGGVVGANKKNIVNCHVSGRVVRREDAETTDNAGGVAGSNYGINGGTATISNCYYTGTIENVNVNDQRVGALVGLNGIGAETNTAILANNYYLSGSVTKGVGTVEAFATATNIGSFASVTSPIAIDSGVTEDETIPTGSLLAALNAGAKAYNATAAEGLNAYRWEKVSQDSYPTRTAEKLFGDVNDDWTVGIADLLLIAGGSYNTATTPDNVLDLNGDSKINFADLAMARNSKYFEK